MLGELVIIRSWIGPSQALVFFIRHYEIRVDKNPQGPVAEGKDDHQYWDYLLLWEYYISLLGQALVFLSPSSSYILVFLLD